MKSKCGGCKAPSREDMAQPSAAAKPVTRRRRGTGRKKG
uniref:Fe-S cluster n=2 Tax=unclassified Caudoviricetes TaxID=2788787 RepID=A0A8S5M3L1_9CAUD|nr:MAG TPA: Putative Fe-S cluster [Siphoviridae sp. ctQJR51]DAD76736.1 MAG TPA: Putative Fe-S cluster [Siphoviridae sp. ctQJR51]DAF96529.1 MAG TPA: putative Fe-S cluster [Siphoviridae sp. ctHj524]DAF96568.1 MAG TPA: putative Fe-S cluster [Siphoviridae sp. ctHj524]